MNRNGGLRAPHHRLTVRNGKRLLAGLRTGVVDQECEFLRLGANLFIPRGLIAKRRVIREDVFKLLLVHIYLRRLRQASNTSKPVPNKSPVESSGVGITLGVSPGISEITPGSGAPGIDPFP